LGRLPAAAYEPGVSVRVYETMAAAARACLKAGQAVIADAVFQEPGDREMIETVARDVGAPFEGIWLEAPPETSLARLESRQGDASDADARVLAAQMARDAGEIRWRRQLG
jgi:predicted kinase